MSNTSTVSQVRDALAKAKTKVEEVKEKGKELTREGGRMLAEGVVAFGAGYADQRYGAVDADTGIRVHQSNGAPTVLVAGVAGKVLAALGIAGDSSWLVFGAASGAIGEGMGTAGRQLAERQNRKSSKVDETESKPNKTASKKAA